MFRISLRLEPKSNILGWLNASAHADDHVLLAVVHVGGGVIFIARDFCSILTGHFRILAKLQIRRYHSQIRLKNQYIPSVLCDFVAGLSFLTLWDTHNFGIA